MSRVRSVRAGGFTLVEILVVVVILGMISAVILPQLGSRSDLVVSAAARQVMSDLSFAQNRAITAQTRVYLVFTEATETLGGGYSVMTALPSTVMNHPVERTPWVVGFGAGSRAWGTVRLEEADFDGATTLMFDESGAPMVVSAGVATPLNDGSVRVSCNGQALTIRVEPLTGTLTVQ